MRRETYQQRVIRRYYEHRPDIMFQRLQELVSELFLADEKRRCQLWKKVELALGILEVPQPRIDSIIEHDDPALLAKLVEELDKSPL